jgi:hypothetical protein
LNVYLSKEREEEEEEEDKEQVDLEKKESKFGNFLYVFSIQTKKFFEFQWILSQFL